MSVEKKDTGYASNEHKEIPQSARDEILKFLANCGMKTNTVINLLLLNLGLGIVQIGLLLSVLLR